MNSLWMLLAGFSFACMNVFVKLGADYFSVAELVFYRAVFTILLVYAWMRSRGDTVRTNQKRLHFRRGISGFVSLYMYYYALTALPLATAVTLSYTSPIFLAVLVLFLAREQLHWPFALAIVGAFAGTVLLLKPTFSQEMWSSGLVAVGSGAMSAVAYYHVRQLVQAGETEGRVVFYFSLYSAIGAGAWLLVSGFHPVTAQNIIYLLGAGFFATVAQVAMTRAYGRGRTLLTGALSYSTVVFSSLFGIIIFADVLPLSSWLAIGLIIAAGIAAIRFAPGKQSVAGAEE